MQILLRAKDIRVDFGERKLFFIPDLEIHDGDRIGLVGINGVGKSTLLSVLSGERAPDEGRVERFSELAVIHQFGGDADAADEYARSAFGVVDSPRPSGGERTRAAIADAVSRDASLLLADEPTSNLDLKAIEQLEAVLMGYRGAVVLICHDRALLDRLCTRIWELENGELRDFPGSYSEWVAEKDRERDFQQFEYDQYRKEKRRLTEAVREARGRASNFKKPPRRMASSEWLLYKGIASMQESNVSNRAAALDSRLSQLEAKDRPADLPDIRMAIARPAPITSRVALRVKDMDIAFDGRVILRGATFEIPAGRRTVCVGPNGSGKSSLVRRILAGDPAAQFAKGVSVGFFGQDHDTLDMEKTVLQNARVYSQKPESAVRTVLARLGMTADAVHKPASVLSGGERAKVCFASLFVSTHNFLLLDEPTNYLDLYTMEALQELLLAWEGTLFVISHDRRLNERIAQHVLTVESGEVTRFDGDWEAYLESRRPKKKDSGKRAMLEAEESRVRMRMAEVTGRLSAPRKGDKLEVLEREWQELVVELRGIQARRGAAGKR